MHITGIKPGNQTTGRRYILCTKCSINIMENINCSFRCVLTTVDMDAGVKRNDGEPLKTLKR
jgi:hypothetical protein